MVPVYDAAGDVTLDANQKGTHQYLYDAEGRICAVKSSAVDGIVMMTGYIYDAEGNRVAKGTITQWSCDPSSNGFMTTANETDYVLNQAGQPVTEMTQDGATMQWQHTNVWADGQLIATYQAATTSSGQPTSNLHFLLNDWLGTRRAMTDYAGVREQTCTSLPFGDAESCTPTPTEQLFTGKERDSESGNDYFGARYFASSMGRMLSPDPVGGSLANPQTLNKYAYVLNNPLRYTDPTGLYACADDAAGAKEHCTSDADKRFEASRQHDLQSKNGAVRAAAGAYGDPGNEVVDARGDKVTVAFSGDVASNGEGGVTHSVLDANGNTPISNSTVTFNPNDKGTALDADVGHEGSHVEDAQTMVRSITFDQLGNYKVGDDISQYRSEQRAYAITDAIYRSANESYNGCASDQCALGAGSSPIGIPGRIDAILLANPKTYHSADGKPLTSTNQGGNVLNLAIPH